MPIGYTPPIGNAVDFIDLAAEPYTAPAGNAADFIAVVYVSPTGFDSLVFGAHAFELGGETGEPIFVQLTGWDSLQFGAHRISDFHIRAVGLDFAIVHAEDDGARGPGRRRTGFDLHNYFLGIGWDSAEFGDGGVS